MEVHDATLCVFSSIWLLDGHGDSLGSWGMVGRHFIQVERIGFSDVQILVVHHLGLALLKQELANQTLSVWESNGWVYRSGGHRNSYGSVGRSGGGPIGASPLSATESRGGGMAKAGVVGSSAPSAEKRRPPVVDSGVRPQGDLRAGSTDDNADFDQYLSFLQSWTEKPGVSGRFDAMDVSGRRFVRIKDAHGNPLPGARVSIVDPRTEHVVWSGTTYGDGRMPFYPSLNPSGGPVVDGLDTPPGGWLVQVKMDEQMQTQRWSSDATGV